MILKYYKYISHREREAAEAGLRDRLRARE